LKNYVKENKDNLCAIFGEPIQGEAGVKIPSTDYFKTMKELSKENNFLIIADEVQSGCGRAGHLSAMKGVHNIDADILILGKSLSGGMFPISCVLANDPVMNVMDPGSHGSTFGGNPLASHVLITAMDVLIEEKMCENSKVMGE